MAHKIHYPYQHLLSRVHSSLVKSTFKKFLCLSRAQNFQASHLQSVSRLINLYDFSSQDLIFNLGILSPLYSLSSLLPVHFHIVCGTLHTANCTLHTEKQCRHKICKQVPSSSSPEFLFVQQRGEDLSNPVQQDLSYNENFNFLNFHLLTWCSQGCLNLSFVITR